MQRLTTFFIVCAILAGSVAIGNAQLLAGFQGPWNVNAQALDGIEARYRARGYKQKRSSGSLAGIVAKLRSQCGARVSSGYRPGAGCHGLNQAVDMTGNYACMYRVLRSWPGGYSTDAGRCRHIHISSCSREWGLRFRHRTC